MSSVAGYPQQSQLTRIPAPSRTQHRQGTQRLTRNLDRTRHTAAGQHELLAAEELLKANLLPEDVGTGAAA